MLRSLVLGVAGRPLIRRTLTEGPGRAVALRFVAGETAPEAMEVCRELNTEGFDVSLDHLGENVEDLVQAERAAAVYREAIDMIAVRSIRANVSIKLSQLGLHLDATRAQDLAAEVVAAASEAGTTVTLDMEDHTTTERTVETCLKLAAAYPGQVGLALQAYLHRTPVDLERLVAADLHVRLCKGAYREPKAVALQKRAAVDRAFASLAVRLLRSDAYAMIASHDERLVRHAIRQIDALGRDPGTYEFQMLYGVRRELQRSLLAEGHRVRIYVPFGAQWYPYLMRRIAERPANARFLVEALVRG